MGFDLTIRFERSECYPRHRDAFVKHARALLSFLPSSPSDEEIWLRSPGSTNPWEYDVRLFFRADALSVEVTRFASSFHEDVRSLVAVISKTCEATLIDDDGERV